MASPISPRGWIPSPSGTTPKAPIVVKKKPPVLLGWRPYIPDTPAPGAFSPVEPELPGADSFGTPPPEPGSYGALGSATPTVAPNVGRSIRDAYVLAQEQSAGLAESGLALFGAPDINDSPLSPTGMSARLEEQTRADTEKYLSPERKASRERMAQENADLSARLKAEGNGFFGRILPEAELSLQHAKEDPLAVAAAGAGAFLPFVVAGPAAAAIGLSPVASAILLGTAAGGGAVKQGIHQTVMQTPFADLMGDQSFAAEVPVYGQEEARKRLASRLQSYSENPGLIAAGFAEGALMGALGPEEQLLRTAGGMGVKDLAAKELAKRAEKGVIRGALETGAKEIGSEAVQEGYEQNLGNRGAAIGGANIDPLAGVSDAAIQAGLMSAPGGVVAGGGEALAARAERKALKDAFGNPAPAELHVTPGAEAVAPAPEAPVPGSTVRAGTAEPTAPEFGQSDLGVGVDSKASLAGLRGAVQNVRAEAARRAQIIRQGTPEEVDAYLRDSVREVQDAAQKADPASDPTVQAIVLSTAAEGGNPARVLKAAGIAKPDEVVRKINEEHPLAIAKEAQAQDLARSGVSVKQRAAEDKWAAAPETQEKINEARYADLLKTQGEAAVVTALKDAGLSTTQAVKRKNAIKAQASEGLKGESDGAVQPKANGTAPGVREAVPEVAPPSESRPVDREALAPAEREVPVSRPEEPLPAAAAIPTIERPARAVPENRADRGEVHGESVPPNVPRATSQAEGEPEGPNTVSARGRTFKVEPTENGYLLHGARGARYEIVKTGPNRFEVKKNQRRGDFGGRLGGPEDPLSGVTFHEKDGRLEVAHETTLGEEAPRVPGTPEEEVATKLVHSVDMEKNFNDVMDRLERQQKHIEESKAAKAQREAENVAAGELTGKALEESLRHPRGRGVERQAPVLPARERGGEEGGVAGLRAHAVETGQPQEVKEFVRREPTGKPLVANEAPRPVEAHAESVPQGSTAIEPTGRLGTAIREDFKRDPKEWAPVKHTDGAPTGWFKASTPPGMRGNGGTYYYNPETGRAFKFENGNQRTAAMAHAFAIENSTKERKPTREVPYTPPPARRRPRPAAEPEPAPTLEGLDPDQIATAKVDAQNLAKGLEQAEGGARLQSAMSPFYFEQLRREAPNVKFSELPRATKLLARAGGPKSQTLRPSERGAAVARTGIRKGELGKPGRNEVIALDNQLEHLIEQGWLPEGSTVGDLVEKLISPEPTYHPGEHATREALNVAEDVARETGITPPAQVNAIKEDKNNPREIKIIKALVKLDPNESQVQLEAAKDRAEPSDAQEPETAVADEEPAPWETEQTFPSGAPTDRGAYLNTQEYERELAKTYKEGEISSRNVPQTVAIPPVGTWRMDEKAFTDGHEIEELAEIPIDRIMVSEDTGSGKFQDVRRYAEWWRDGLEPPPIRVLQTAKGNLKATDHRRLLAAKVLGKDTIKAWVSWTVPSDRPGNPPVGLTYELAKNGATKTPIGEPPAGSTIMADDSKRLDQLREEFAPAPRKATSTEKTKAGTQVLLPGAEGMMDTTGKVGKLKKGQEDVNRGPLFTQDEEAEKKADAAKQRTIGEEPTKIEDVGEKIGGARKDLAVKTGPKGATGEPAEERNAWQKRFSIGQIAGGNDEGKWVVRDAKDGRLDRPLGIFDTKEQAEKFQPMAAVGATHRIYQGIDGKFKIEKRVGDRKSVQVVEQTFPTRDEALAYMAQHAEEILALKTNFGEEVLPRPDPNNVARIGAVRRTGDVKANDFKDAFGFRGVEFGNWNAQDERQTVMNQAYDSLLDLAETLGIPPKAISLNGDLGLAFGARGHGLIGARAHYEPTYGVINLTKMQGAGALAHEWFHSLDHYFARLDGKAAADRVVGPHGTMVYQNKGDTHATVGFGYKSNVREEVRQKFKALMDTIASKAEKYVDDTAKVEKWLKVTRDELAQGLDSIRKSLATPSEWELQKRKTVATPEQLARFDALAEQILNGDALTLEFKHVETPKSPRPKFSMGAYRWTNAALEEISALMKKVRNRSGFSEGGALSELTGRMKRYAERLATVKDARAGTEKTKLVPTSFSMNARQADQGRVGDYWRTPWEMAARAFESYVEDRLSDNAARTDFLTFGTKTAVIPTPWGLVRPYPTGEERVAINKSFDDLFKTIQTKETDKGVAMFARKPSAEEGPSFARPSSPFYSSLERASEQMKQPMRGAEAMRFLSTREGVKAAEMRWVGLDDFLQKRAGERVTPQEVQDFLKANAVTVTEVQKTDDSEKRFKIEGRITSAEDAVAAAFRDRNRKIEAFEIADNALAAAIDDVEMPWRPGVRNRIQSALGSPDEEFEVRLGKGIVDDFRAKHGKLLEEARVAASERNASERILKDAERALDKAEEEKAHDSGRPKFAQYQTPGGSNYREVLLTLPTEEKLPAFSVGKGRYGDWTAWLADGSGNSFVLNTPFQASKEEAESEARRVISRSLAGTSGQPAAFRSSHFDEPNILAHVRMNDRTVNGKKVLFVEEIQSDWAQKGRREGFASKPKSLQITGGSKEKGFFEVGDEAGRFVTNVTEHDVPGLDRDAVLAEAQRRVDTDPSKTMFTRHTPTAPFVEKTEDWTGLALKAILHKAAAEGYDSVAWTTGDMQAARYDLSKQLTHVTIVPVENEFAWHAETKSWQQLGSIRTDAGGKIIKANSDYGDVVGKNVADVFGKDIADKGLSVTKETRLSGLDLKVGGEGMKAFYDKIVPQVAEKIAKKWGARTSELTIPTETREGVTALMFGKNTKYSELSERGKKKVDDFLAIGSKKVHALPITPEMRASVTSEGFPLFKRPTTEKDFEYYGGRHDVERTDEAAEAKYKVSPQVSGAQAGVRVVDFEGDVPKAVIPTMVSSPSTAALANRIGGAVRMIQAHIPEVRFGGFTPAGNLHGVKVGDRFFVNHLATHQIALEASAREGLPYQHVFAREMTRVILHEAAHFLEKGHGAEFIAALAKLEQDLGPKAIAAIRRDMLKFALDNGYQKQMGRMYDTSLPGWREYERLGREAADAAAGTGERPGRDSSRVTQRLQPGPRGDTGDAEGAGGEGSGSQGSLLAPDRDAAEGLAGPSYVRGTDGGVSSKLRRAFSSPAVAAIFEGGPADAGPFDGGCLICAKAIIRANDGGSLVRIVSDANGGQTEHYGAEVGGEIMDASGVYDSPQQWLAAFRKQEAIPLKGRKLSLAEGFDETSEIPDDPTAEKQIARLLDPIFRSPDFARKPPAPPSGGEGPGGASVPTPQDLKDPTFWEKATEWRKGAMLSSVRNIAQNAVGNVVSLGGGLAEIPFAAAADKLLNKGERQVYAEELATSLAAFRREGPEAFARFKNDFRDAMHGIETQEQHESQKFESHRNAIGGGKNSGPIEKKIGTAIRTSFRIMGVTDAFFKDMAYQQALYREAYRQARNEGLNGAAAASRVDRTLGDFHGSVGSDRTSAKKAIHDGAGTPTQRAMHAKADYAARYRTFTLPADYENAGAFGKIAQQAADWERTVPVLGPTLGLAVPFKITPAHVAFQAYERTPAAAFSVAKRWSELGTLVDKMKQAPDEETASAIRSQVNKKTEELVNTTARAALGTVLAAVGFALAAAGLLTGSGPPDPDDRRVWQDAGNIPNAMRIGDSWYAYDRLDPVMNVIGLAANLTQASNEKDANKLMAAYMNAMQETFVNSTFLDGFQRFSDMLKDPTRYGKAWLQNTEGSFVPAIVRQTAEEIDPTVRSRKGIIAPITSGIPGLSKSLPPVRTGTGEPAKRTQRTGEGILGPLSPLGFIRTGDAKGDPLAKEFVAADYSPDPHRDFISVGVGPVGLKQQHRVDLTEKELDVFRRADEQTTRRLREVIKSDGWKNLSPEQKKAYFSKAYAEMSAKAKEAIMPAVAARLRAKLGARR